MKLTSKQKEVCQTQISAVEGFPVLNALLEADVWIQAGRKRGGRLG